MPRTIREIRIEGNIAYVPLTKGYEAVIDVADVPLVSGKSWYASEDGNTVYAKAYASDQGKKTSIMMHRVLTGYKMTDHRDGDGLNNRRNNLRESTSSTNQFNQRLSAANTSGFKGVSWNKASKKWQARIRIDGQNTNLGFYHDPVDAHAAYCQASARFHGEYSRTA